MGLGKAYLPRETGECVLTHVQQSVWKDTMPFEGETMRRATSLEVALMLLTVLGEIVHTRFYSWVTLLSVRNIISSIDSISSVVKWAEQTVTAEVQERENSVGWRGQNVGLERLESELGVEIAKEVRERIPVKEDGRW